MDEERTQVRKRNRRHAPGLVLLLALILLAALAFVFRDSLRGPSGHGAAQQSEAFTYEIGAGQVFAPAGSGLAVAASSAVQLLDGEGATVFRQAVSFETPAVFASAKGALFCDLGGTGCVRAGFDGAGRTLEPAGELITASMNEKGWFTLTTAAAGYKALVSVYDASAALRYQWWSGTGYVLKALLSPDSQLLAVLCAESGGGKLHVFRLDSEAEYGMAAFAGELPFDLAFLGGDTLCAVGEEALTFLAADGAVTGRYALDGRYLLDYDLGGAGFAALYINDYRGGGGRIELVDRKGNLLGSVEADRDVTCLSASGKKLLAMTAGGLALYDGELNLLYTRTDLAAAKAALLRPDGDILLLSAWSAERIVKPS